MSGSFRDRASRLSIVLSLCAASALAQTGTTTGGGTQQPVFVLGKAALADGGPLPEKAEIQLVCQTQAQTQGRTDSAGNFNFQIGSQRFQGASDASASSAAAGGSFGGALSQSGAPSGAARTQVDGMSVVSLMGCFLRASLRGYRSEVYDLSRMHAGDNNTNVGTLLLYSLASGPAKVVNARSFALPKDVQRILDRAHDLIAKRQFADAEKELNKATQSCPKCAGPWQELGSLLQSQNRNGDARNAYLQAIAADAKLPGPYLSLARLSAAEKNWADARDRSAALLEIEPSAYPLAYYYHAVATYNLGEREKAFASARQAVNLDTSNAVPQAEQLLGVLYAAQGDYKSAAEQFRNYLRDAPAAANAEAVRAMLADAEKRAAQGAPK